LFVDVCGSSYFFTELPFCGLLRSANVLLKLSIKVSGCTPFEPVLTIGTNDPFFFIFGVGFLPTTTKAACLSVKHPFQAAVLTPFLRSFPPVNKLSFTALASVKWTQAAFCTMAKDPFFLFSESVSFCSLPIPRLFHCTDPYGPCSFICFFPHTPPSVYRPPSRCTVC